MKKTKTLFLSFVTLLLAVFGFASSAIAADPAVTDCRSGTSLETCQETDWANSDTSTQYTIRYECEGTVCKSTITICAIPGTGSPACADPFVEDGVEVRIEEYMPDGSRFGAPPGSTSEYGSVMGRGSTPQIMGMLKWVINILSGAVLVVAVIMLIIGSIQYSASGGDPNGVKAAKTKIMNVLIGIVAYVFLYAFLQWLIPGSVF